MFVQCGNILPSVEATVIHSDGAVEVLDLKSEVVTHEEEW